MKIIPVFSGDPWSVKSSPLTYKIRKLCYYVELDVCIIIQPKQMISKTTSDKTIKKRESA